MTNDLISIIFPVYNAQEYLPVSVGAVLAQTYQNFELILVDDGSTDASGRICDGYAAQDARVKVFHKPNGGHSSAVNYGLARMTGKYVMICDTDDYYEPDAFQIAHERITQADEPDVVVFAVFRSDKELREDPASLISYEKRRVNIALLSGETYDYCNAGFNIESTWAKIIRADIIREYSVRMPEQLFLAEDAVFCLRLFEHCNSVVLDSHRIYHYYIRTDSFCRSYSDVAARMLEPILAEQSGFLQEYYPDDQEYHSANDRAVLAWFNEAEEHFFFHENNRQPLPEVYSQYKQLLRNPVIQQHIRNLSYSDASSIMRKFRLLLYKNPSYILFRIYCTLKKRRQS